MVMDRRYDKRACAKSSPRKFCRCTVLVGSRYHCSRVRYVKCSQSMGEESSRHRSSVIPISTALSYTTRAHIFHFACAGSQGGQRRPTAVTKKEALDKAKDPSRVLINDWLPYTT